MIVILAPFFPSEVIPYPSCQWNLIIMFTGRKSWTKRDSVWLCFRIIYVRAVSVCPCHGHHCPNLHTEIFMCVRNVYHGPRNHDIRLLTLVAARMDLLLHRFRVRIVCSNRLCADDHCILYTTVCPLPRQVTHDFCEYQK